MNDPRDPAGKPGKDQRSAADARRERLAAQLRENLRKRKAKARSAGEKAQKPPQKPARD